MDGDVRSLKAAQRPLDNQEASFREGRNLEADTREAQARNDPARAAERWEQMGKRQAEDWSWWP